MTRRGRLAAVLTLVALLLTGCASLPRSGPVVAGDPDLPDSDGVALVAYGPAPDAEPQAIVQGFLRAVAAGAGDEFTMAREFLAGPVSHTWNPRAQVWVHAARDEIAISQAADGTVRASATAVASIDAEGRYTEAAPDTTVDLDFSLVRGADGQWRIVDLEDGILISPADFDAQYAQLPVYFLTADREALVPETRWFSEQHAATAVVRGLLEGPSPWLAAGVTSAIPVGTRLTVDSVSVLEGIAEVDLSPEVLAAEPEQRGLVMAQLEASLRSVSSVQAVRVTVAGSPFELEEPVPVLVRNPYVTANPVVVSADELLRFNGLDVVPVSGALPMPDARLRAPALPYENAEGPMVVLDGTDRLVTVATTEAAPVVLVESPDLVAPTVDRHGWVWTSPRSSDGALVAARENGATVPVEASWLAGSDILSLRVSREGARAVIVRESEGASHVEIAAVVRDRDGTPRALGDPVRLGEVLTSASAVTWVDEETVAVLGTSGTDEAPSVHLLTVGGPTTDLPAVERATTVTAGTGDRTLLLGTSDGQLFERNGLGWSLAVTAVADPAYPG
ncbi:LpqB family beta-propeller domain-containing protein [Georgenia faecalis]|uniref:LpqB family beta-propeller domain-containing protein n=1 Tax=Georgenia faecalis TaxID=2483799 RepID=A0ABV9DB56_9MICO|nr:LpqB family beta-propeller domain-containing protein [Georgenia faecalis]